MDDLIAFVLARLDAIANGGRPDQHEKMCGYDQIEFEAECDCDVPKAVLDDIAAKRQIIALHETVPVAPGRPDTTCTECGMALNAPCPTLRLLALPFASHPDYRTEWRP